MGSRENYFWSVGGQNNNPKFQGQQSKNRNIDHQGEKTCAIMSTKVTYETNLIYLLPDSIMSSALNFCFLCILL